MIKVPEELRAKLITIQTEVVKLENSYKEIQRAFISGYMVGKPELVGKTYKLTEDMSEFVLSEERNNGSNPEGA